jgi:hypothetical protein
MTEILIAIFIHIVVPSVGLGFFLRLKTKMKKEEVTSPPTIELFIIFATYGGLLLVTLTTLFWKWSGLASLGTFYLITGAPIIMGLIAYRNYKRRLESKYRDWTFNLGLLYYAIAPLTFAVLFIADRL